MRAEVTLSVDRYKADIEDCLYVRPIPQKRGHYMGTVALKTVIIDGSKIRGELVSELGNQIMPRNSGWRLARYVDNEFVDAQNGNTIQFAAGVLMVGSKIYYRES